MRTVPFGLMRKVTMMTLMLGAFIAMIHPASAQVLYGSVTGNVSDQSGAIVPDATITLTNKSTGQVREANASSDGNYTISNVLPGIYDIKVTKQGFSTYAETGLNISANNVARIDARMKVGNVSEVVSVTANATQIQTESAVVKSEISSKEIQSLPINNYRNYQSLLNLVPGTTPAGFQNATTDTPERSLTTNVNGTARNNNNTRLDGAQSVNIWLPHHSAYVPPSESIAEVNISTNNFDAEQGLAGGAAVQVISKSGSNEFHGSAFAYHDNHALRARNVFQAEGVTINNQFIRTPNKPKNLRTIPGGTIGGPILRDKLFFFGSWEGMYESTIRDGRFTVPTADIRAGNFSAYTVSLFDPLTGNIDGTGRTTFADPKVIPAARISPITQKILALIPLPNLPGATANYYNSAPVLFNRNNYDVKVNWNRSINHQIWTKFSHMNASVKDSPALGDAVGPAIGGGGIGTGLTKSYVGTVGHTLTIGSGIIVDGNFSVTHRDHATQGTDFGKNIGLDVLGIPGTNGSDIRQSGFPQFYFNTYTGLGNQNNWSPVTRAERSYTFTQNAAKVVNNHDFRIGVDIVRHELNHWQPEIGVGPRGAFNFTGRETTLNGGAGPNQYNSFAAFLLGTPASVQKSLQYEVMTTREVQMGFFFRDRWQVSKKLTLSLGLRYELFPMMHRADRGIELLDLNSAVQLNSAGLPNGNMKVLIGGKGSNPSDLGVGSSKKLFAPRLGLAYRIGDDTVIRLGYGLTYDPMPFGRPLRGFYPATVAQTFIATATGANETYTPFGFTNAGRGNGLQLGIPAFNGPDLSSGIVDLPGTVEMRSPYKGTLHRGYIQSWNLFVDRKVYKDIRVEVGYVGTATAHQFADININVAQAPGARRFLQDKYGRTANTLLWDGFLSSNYHALQVAVNRRLSNGFFLKGAYTYSKAINMADDTGWAGLPLFNAQSQISRNRARAGYDIPHNFQMGAAYELPFGKGKKFATEGVASHILGGWQLTGIASAVTGRPFTVTADAGSVNAPGNSQTPDIVGTINQVGGVGNVFGTNGASNFWYDPAAFAVVTGTPRWGTAGRNILRNPGYANIDISVVRTFHLTERTTLDFRVDTFNSTNTPHFNGPGSNISGGNFMIITSAAQDQRQFRLGLRFGF